MIICNKQEGFAYLTIRICDSCCNDKATVCIQFEPTDILFSKLSKNRFYCHKCYNPLETNAQYHSDK
jgi:hypothetical protein